MKSVPEKDLYIIDRGGKVTEEAKWIANPQSVTINGIETPVSPGFQIILRHRIEKENCINKQISFFIPSIDETEEFISLKRVYLETLCKAVIQPMEKFVAEVLCSNEYKDSKVIFRKDRFLVIEFTKSQDSSISYKYLVKNGVNILTSLTGSAANMTIDQIRGKYLSSILNDFVNPIIEFAETIKKNETTEVN